MHLCRSLFLGSILLLGACDDGPSGPDPTLPASVQLSHSEVELPDGGSVQLTASVRNAGGDPIPGAAVAWESNDDAVAAVDGTGRVEALSVGTARVTASAGAHEAAVEVTVRHRAASIHALSEQALAGAAGTTLDSLAVNVVDIRGDPAVGVEVGFAVTAGGGSVSPEVVMTDAEGQARTAWTLGTAGGENRVEATVEGVEVGVAFTAEAHPGEHVAEESVGPAGGTVATESGTSVIVPAGALASAATVTIAPADPPEARQREVVPGTVFDFGPDGLTFTQPVQIRIPYEIAQLPQGASEQALRLHRLESGSWVRVAASRVDTADREVVGETSHFSIYAVRVAEPVAPRVEVAGPDTISSTFGLQGGVRFAALAQSEDAIDRIEYSLNGSAFRSIEPFSALDSVEVTITVPGAELQRGDNVFTVRAVTQLGGAAEKSFDVVLIDAEEIGTTQVEISAPAEGAIITGDTVYVSFAAAGDSIFVAVVASVDEAGNRTIRGTQFFFTEGPVPSEVEHTFAIPVERLSLGTNRLRVEVSGRNLIYVATGADEVSVEIPAAPVIEVMAPDTITSTFMRDYFPPSIVIITSHWSGIGSLTYSFNGSAPRALVPADTVQFQLPTGIFMPGENTLRVVARSGSGAVSEHLSRIHSLMPSDIGTTSVTISAPVDGAVVESNEVAITVTAVGDTIFGLVLARVDASGTRRYQTVHYTIDSDGPAFGSVEHTFRVAATAGVSGEVTYVVEAHGRNNLLLATGDGEVTFTWNPAGGP